MPLFPSLSSNSADDLLTLKLAIRKNAADNFNQFVEVQNDWIRFIWYNPAFTPTAIVNSLSADAVNYFNLTTNLRVMLSAAAINNSVTVNLLKPLSAFSLSGNHVTIFNAPYTGA